MSTPPRARPPGMYDVARLAGVSHQTVSRVINAHPNVAEATRRRVQQAITELGYRRNVAARTLVTRRFEHHRRDHQRLAALGPEHHPDRGGAGRPGRRLLRERGGAAGHGAERRP